MPSTGCLELSQVPATQTQINVVVTCKGRLAHLAQTIPLLLAQKCSHAFRIIAVDYGDPDDCFSWCKNLNHPRLVAVKVLDKVEPFSLSRARNCGANVLPSDILCFVDGDSLVSRDFLEFVSSLVGSGRATLVKRTFQDSDTTIAGVCCVRTSAFHAVRGYDEAFEGWGPEDLDFYRRIWPQGPILSFPHWLYPASIPHTDEERTRYYETKNRMISAAKSVQAMRKSRIVNPVGYGRASILISSLDTGQDVLPREIKELEICSESCSTPKDTGRGDSPSNQVESRHGRPLSEAGPFPTSRKRNPMHRVVWQYWEGPMPSWIERCMESVRLHAPQVRVLSRDSEILQPVFEIPGISMLPIANQTDLIRAYLLATYGGWWIDADCIVTRPLSPILDLLDEHEFVASPLHDGKNTATFAGSRAGGAIALDWHRRQKEFLAQGRRGWLLLAHDSLTPALGMHPWLRVEPEVIEPILWDDTWAFDHCASDQEHAAHFSLHPHSYAYMMSNSRRHRGDSPGNGTAGYLLESNSFFSFLLRTSEANVGAKTNHGADGTNNRRQRRPSGSLYTQGCQDADEPT